MKKVKLLPAIVPVLALFILCLCGGCGDDGAQNFNFPAGPSGATGSTGSTGPDNVYSLRIDVTHGGQPVSGFTIALERLGASEEGNLEGNDSSGQGWYQFDSLFPGNYKGTLEADNFETKFFNVTVPAPGNQVSVTMGQWAQQDPGVSSGRLIGVSFPDPNNGWAVGVDYSSGTGIAIITHTSSGTDWAPQTPPATTDSFSLSGVSFPDATTGWSAGMRMAPGNISDPAIIHTSDGTNWAFQTVPPVIDPNVAGTSEFLNEVDFVNTTTGWAVGGYRDPNTSLRCPIILNTTNGTLWNIQTPPDPNDNYYLYGVDFVGSLIGWAVGSGKIIHTQDGGNTWTTQYSTDIILNFTGVHFIDASRGWVAGDTGILYTSDGGTTWNVATGSNHSLYDVFFADSDTGWAVGYQSILHKSAGNDWMYQGNMEAGIFSELFRTQFVNSQTGWAVGVDGTYPNEIPIILNYSE